MGGFWSRRRRGREDATATGIGHPGELDGGDAMADVFPEEWRAALHRRVHWWRLLPPDDRARLEDLTARFVARMRWEAARDFSVTDEMRVVVAASACRLTLGLREEIAAGVDPFARVTSVILHRSTVRLRGQRSAGAQGVMADGPYSLHGQAHMRGPVVLAWSAVTSDLAHPRRGRNVVMHEFAHQLDMLDGDVDGLPPLGDDDALDEWERVRDREFKALQAQRANPILDEYAATNHAEFFAVVTELFFTRPLELREEIPDLYSVLALLFRQDPAALVPVPPPRPPGQAGTPRPTAP